MSMPNLPPGSSTTADDSDERLDDPTPITIDRPPRQDSHGHGAGRQWRRRVTREIRKLVTGMMRRISGRARKLKAEEDCIRVLEVTRETVDGEYINLVIARALFDTGCPVNLVTRQWIRNHDMGHLLKPVSDENDYDIVRHHGVESRVIAEIEMEWYGVSEDRKGQIVFLKKNTPRDHFLVVPDTDFDIIIGLETIRREGLTTRKRWCYGDTQGGYSHVIKTPSEKTRQAGREKQRRQKEEQRAQRSQQSRGGNNNGNNNGNNGGTGSSPKST